MRNPSWSHEWEQDPDPEVRAELEMLGGQLVRLRVRAGWSQRVLAAHCQLDQSTISRVERGRAPGMRLASFVRIIAALGGRVDGGAPAGTWR
jgi:transcriptional regulator with XRE-family HTH domain